VEYYLDLQEAAALSGFSDCNFFLGEPSPINILQASGIVDMISFVKTGEK